MITKRMGALFSSIGQIADWQYVSKIHNSLKQSNINQAMRYLINSHLDGIVLDRQTFYNLHLKMSEAKVNASYHELAYKLYRESFSPHILMSEWMKGLLTTKDKKLQQLLSNDFQTLNIQMPKKQSEPEIKTPQVKIEKKTGSEPNTQIIATQEKQTLSPTSNQVKTKDQNYFLINEINSEVAKLIKKNGFRIVIHNIEFERTEDEYEEEEEEGEDDEKILKIDDQTLNLEQMERSEEFIESLMDLMTSMKLRIGKIEILVPNSDDKHNKP